MLCLLPERAVWWERERTVFVSDAHLGREIGLRNLGVPVPEGASLETVRRLAACGSALGARRLVVLGDLFHSREARTVELEVRMGRMLSEVFAERWLVRGNHDAGSGDPLECWGFRVFDEGERLGPFELFHAPPEVVGRPALAGHVHPVLWLEGAARLRARVPAFWMRSGVLVLPSFGEFTGGVAVGREPDCRLWVCDGERVREVRVRARRGGCGRVSLCGSTTLGKLPKLSPP